MADSPRWCAECNGYGDHHTDRHPTAAPVPPVPDVREAVREAIKGARMVPYEGGTGGWLFRGATDDELADAVLAVPAIATALGGGTGGLRGRVQALMNEWEAAAADLRAQAQAEPDDGLRLSLMHESGIFTGPALCLRTILRTTAPDPLAQQRAILEVISEHRRVNNVRRCSAGGCAWRPNRSGRNGDEDAMLQRHADFNQHLTDMIMERLAAL